VPNLSVKIVVERVNWHMVGNGGVTVRLDDSLYNYTLLSKLKVMCLP